MVATQLDRNRTRGLSAKQAAVPPSRNGHLRSALIAAGPLVETPRVKIERSDVGSLEGLIPSLKRLVLRLFDAPMTLREALEQFGNARNASSYVDRINEWCREHIGRNGVVRESLTGRRRSAAFWVMRLDGTAFDVDYTGWDVRQHVRLADVLSPQHRRIVQQIAQLGYVQLSELKGVLPERALTERHSIFSDINRECAAKGFPPPIRRTESRPNLYSVTPAFRKLFSMPAPAPRKFEELFGETDAGVIHHLAEHGKTRPSVLGPATGIPTGEMSDRACAINKRCRELNLPQAIRREGPPRIRRYGLTERFVSRFGWASEQRDLACFFSARQIDLIRWLAQNPFAITKDMARGIGLRSLFMVGSHLRNIEQTCKRNNLPSLTKIGECNCRWALSKAFGERFGLPVCAASPMAVLRTERQRRIYRYFEQHPDPDPDSAAHALKINRRGLRARLREINRKLKQAGIPTLILRVPGQTKYREFSVVSRTLLEIRIRDGQWPRRARELKRADAGLYYGVRIHGGITSVINRMLTTLDAGEREAIVQSDLDAMRTWNFSKYEERAADVIKACAGATIRGSERRELVRILEKHADATTAIAAINRISTPFALPVPDAEISAAGIRNERLEGWWAQG